MEMLINADDFGYCPERNLGIIDCYKSGAITDTSLLVNSTYGEEAANLGLEYKLPMGLHFNMSEGKPVSDPSEVKSLLYDGCFRGKAGTVEAAKDGKLVTEDVKRELVSQIERFKSLTGSYPKRVDGHQHFHVFPVIRTAFAQVLEQFNITQTRLPIGSYVGMSDLMSESTREYLQKVTHYAEQSRDVFSQHSIRSTDAFIGCSLMSQSNNSPSGLTLDHFKSAVQSLPPSTKTVEFMVHPGYLNRVEDGGCGVGPDDYSKDIGRKLELEFLMSEGFRDYLNSLKIRLTTLERLT